AGVVQAVGKELEAADVGAKAEEVAVPPAGEEEPQESEAERATRSMQKETTRALRARERALKRVDTMKDRLLELESGVAAARRELRGSEEARERLEAERDRLARDRDALPVH